MLAVDLAAKPLELLPDLSVRLNILARGRSDLHQRRRLAVLRIELEQAPERPQPFRQPFRVVQPIDPDDVDPRLASPAQLLDLERRPAATRHLGKGLRVDSSRVNNGAHDLSG